MKYGLFWSALCLSFGIFLYGSLPLYEGIAAAAVFFVLPALAAIKITHKKEAVLILCGAFFISLCGMGRMHLADEVWKAQSSWALHAEGTYTAVVTEPPVVNREGEGYARYTAELKDIRYKDGTEKPLKGFAYVYETNPKEIYGPGVKLSVKGEMTPIRIYDNPGKIDLESRYRSRRIIGRIYTEDEKSVRSLGDSGEYRAEKAAELIKGKVMDTFAPYMDPVRLHIMMTLLFGGSYNEIPESVMSSFSATGIVHILSVSGSHVALLFGFLYFLGKWMHLPKKLVIGGAIILVLFYSGLAGFVPPVLRAAIMGILSVAGLFFDREKTAVNILGAAVTGMLLWDPFFLFDVSFQLSVGASAGILIFYKPLLYFFKRFPRLPVQVREGTALSTAAQVFTMPIVLYDFHVFPLFFIPANLIVTPFLEWVIIAGLMASVIALIFTPLAAGILYVSDYLLWAGIRMNQWMSGWPKASIGIGGLNAAETACYYITVAFLYFREKILASKIWRRIFMLILPLSTAIVIFLWISAPSTYVLVPELGPDQGAVLVKDGRKILYYKSGSLASRTSVWEWNSLLGYEGIFAADILLLNLEDAKNPIPLSMTIPIKEIWVTGGDPEKICRELLAGQQAHVRMIQGGSAKVDDMIFRTNGSSWIVSFDEAGVLFSGNKLLTDTKYPPGLFWMAGSRKQADSLTEEEVSAIHPEAAVYAGSRLTKSYEDAEIFEYMGIPAANVYEDGMQTAVFREKWELKGKGLWR